MQELVLDLCQVNKKGQARVLSRWSNRMGPGDKELCRSGCASATKAEDMGASALLAESLGIWWCLVWVLEQRLSNLTVGSNYSCDPLSFMFVTDKSFSVFFLYHISPLSLKTFAALYFFVQLC